MIHFIKVKGLNPSTYSAVHEEVQRLRVKSEIAKSLEGHPAIQAMTADLTARAKEEAETTYASWKINASQRLFELKDRLGKTTPQTNEDFVEDLRLAIKDIESKLGNPFDPKIQVHFEIAVGNVRIIPGTVKLLDQEDIELEIQIDSTSFTVGCQYRTFSENGADEWESLNGINCEYTFFPGTYLFQPLYTLLRLTSHDESAIVKQE